MTSQGGSTDLTSLLRTMKPILSPSTYLFCTIPFASTNIKVEEGHDDDNEKEGFSSFPLPELPKGVFVQCLFREAEGWSLVIKQQDVDKQQDVEGSKKAKENHWGGKKLESGLKAQFEDRSNRWSLITLNVHSSLLAVGFIAVVSERFGREGIPCNVVAGYFHDHVFVPVEKARLAVNVLEKLSRGD